MKPTEKYRSPVCRRLGLFGALLLARTVSRVGLSITLLTLPVPLTNASRHPIQQIPKAANAPQQGKNALELNKPVEREIAGGQTHSYQIALIKGQFLHVVVEQIGIDVVITLYGARDEKLVEVDSPNGTEGPEPLTLIAEATGVYRFEVRSLEGNAPPGRYRATVEALRDATDDDVRRVSELRALKEADQLTDQVIELNNEGKYGQAIPLAERVVTIREKVLGAEHPDVASALNNLATMYVGTGDFKRAARLHERALEIKQKSLGAEHVSTANSLINLAEAYREMGEFVLAEPLYQRAIAVFEKALGSSHPKVADALNKLALLHDDKGDFAAAEPLYLRALAIREKELGAEHHETAITLVNLTNLYKQTGDLVRAEEVGRRALDSLEKAVGSEHPFFATALNNLALVYVARGDYRRAEALHQRALAIREKAFGPEHPDVAASLYNLAALYSREGDVVRAERLYQRILAIDEKAYGSEHPNLASDLNNLASIHEANGRLSEAESLYQRALAISEKALGPEHPQVASVLNNLSLVYYRKGDLGRAEALGQRALTIREKTLGARHPDVAVSLSNMAAFYEAKGDIARAISFRTRGNDIREYNLSLVLTAGSEQEKLLFASTFAGETDLTISLHTRSAPTSPEAASLALTTILRRKGRVLDAVADQVGALRRGLDVQDQSLLTRLFSVQTQLAGLLLRGLGSREPTEYREMIARLGDEAERLQASVSSRSVRFRLQTQTVTAGQVQAALPAGTALVELVRYTPHDFKSRVIDKARYAAYVLRNEGSPRWVDLGEAGKIDGKIDGLRKSLGDPNDINVKGAAREFDELVMRPIRKLLGDGRRLFLSPDGALNLVPFAALVDERGRYLVEDYSISYLTSGRDLLRPRGTRASRQGPVVIADPLFDFNSPTGGRRDAGGAVKNTGRRSADMAQLKFGPLPGTADEAKALSAVLTGARVLTQGQATEEELRRVTAPSVLHIATHGFFLPDRRPEGAAAFGRSGAVTSDAATALGVENSLLRSGLALAGANMRLDDSGNDGILTSLEAAGLDLWGTRLVVLSACETGIGEVKVSEGVYGLRRALVIAGSESQVISLWKVSDSATREFMASFYGRLRKGEGRTEALRRVQQELLKGERFQHPFFWAAFIQSGDWGPLSGE